MTSILPQGSQTSPQKKIFITGGGGFIGANLARKLVEQKYQVHLLLKKSTNPWRLKDLRSKIHVHTLDLLDTKRLAMLFKRTHPAIIYHSAAYGRSEDQADEEKMIDVNIKGTLSLLEASRSVGYTLLVNIGSSSEYGFKKKPMKESDIVKPASFYAVSKASATYLCSVFAKQWKKPIVTIRPFSVFGPFEEKTRFIPTIMRALLEQKPILLTSGRVRRDFIFIDDFVDACLTLITHAKNVSGTIINLGSGKEYTNDEVVKMLFKITRKTTLVKKGSFPKRSWDTNHWMSDNRLARKLLKWKPKTTLDKGLYKTYIWFEENLNLYS